jgi:hypothetical protein
VVLRRGRGKTVCARGADPALLGSRSTSPLGRIVNPKLMMVYFVVWTVCAVGTTVLFWRRDPAFKRRWHRPIAIFNTVVIGGFILVFVAQMAPPWWVFLIFLGTLLFIGWVSVFQTRVCAQCGKICQPDNLVTAPRFCRSCGAKLD